MARPYIAVGCDQQGRAALGRLTQASLDARQAERAAAALSLPDLLLSKGSMTGPHKTTKPLRRSRARRFLRALLAFLAAPSAHL